MKVVQILSVVGLLLVTGCDQSETSKRLVGDWVGSAKMVPGEKDAAKVGFLSKMKFQLSLKQDGKCSFGMGPMQQAGTWTASKDSLTMNLGEKTGKPCPVSFSGPDEFSLTRETGGLTFVRKK